MKLTFKKIMSQIFLSHIGRIGLSALLLVIGGIMSPYGIIGENIYHWDEGKLWSILMYIGGVTITIQILLFIIYAWVINPIKALRERNKNK